MESVDYSGSEGQWKGFGRYVDIEFALEISGRDAFDLFRYRADLGNRSSILFGEMKDTGFYVPFQGQELDGIAYLRTKVQRSPRSGLAQWVKFYTGCDRATMGTSRTIPFSEMAVSKPPIFLSLVDQWGFR